MVEISNIQTESARIISDASATREVIDALGRKITIRKTNNVLRRNVAKALSKESLEKPELHYPALIAFHVVAIDGDQVPVPKTELQAEALQDRLGDEGMIAISTVLAEQIAAASVVDVAKN